MKDDSLKIIGIAANLSADEKARMLADAREKELRDQMSRERGAREEGRLEGIKENQLMIVRNLIKTGLSIVDIAKVTDLPVSEIEKLKQ